MSIKLRILLTITAAIIIAAGSIYYSVPHPSVEASGTVGISLSSNDTPQFDIAQISDIPAYGVIEPSGCGVFKGRVKIRIDCYLDAESSYYSQYGGAYVVDETSPEYLAGYPGKIDEKTGEPLDWDAYNHWWDSLPTVWQENPFHSHFVYYDKEVTDDAIKYVVAEVTEYFYAFHLYCWDNELTFLSQWVKVPKQAGTIRDVFIAGDSSPPNKTACEDKADDILTRLPDFDTRIFDETPESPYDLNIGEKGTIDVGYYTEAALGSHSTGTAVEEGNPANADGSLDTIFLYASLNIAGTIQAATFINEGGNVFSTRDSEDLGSALVGFRTFTGLTIDVITGDYIGAWIPDSALSTATSGGIGKWESNSDYVPCSSQEFGYYREGYRIALYGTGTEGGGPAITNTETDWGPGILSVGSTAETVIDWSTIENTGTGAVDITIQGTDLDNAGSTAWDLADNGVPDADVYGLWAGLVGNTAAYVSYNTGYENTYGVYGDDWYAQTFTPSASHHITDVKLYVEYDGSPGDVTVGIRNTSANHPTGADLCYCTVAGTSLPGSIDWYTFNMDTGYDLVAGTKYAIVVRAPSGSAMNWVLWGGDDTSPTYSGGSMESSSNGGVDWTTIGIDFLFEEWGDDFPTPVPESSAALFIEDLAEDATYDWSMKLTAPSSFDVADAGGTKTITVTLVASKHT